MLDLKYVLANVEAVKQNCRNRNVPADIVDEVDRVVALEGERKGLLQEVEEVRRRQNEVAQATGKEKDPAKRGRARRRGEAAQGRGRRAARSGSRQLEAELKQRLGRIPNLTHPDAPVGHDRGRRARSSARSARPAPSTSRRRTTSRSARRST